MEKIDFKDKISQDAAAMRLIHESTMYRMERLNNIMAVITTLSLFVTILCISHVNKR